MPSMTERAPSRRATTKDFTKGFTLIEVTVAMMIFLAMVLMFAAVFPLAVRTALFSNNYAQAVALCQHKMDQLRQEGFTNLSDTGNVLSSDSVIDATTPPTAYPYSYTFTTCDNLASYYPSGATGTITINQATNTAGSAMTTVDTVAITIQWTTGSKGTSSYTLNAMIVKNEPNQN